MQLRRLGIITGETTFYFHLCFTFQSGSTLRKHFRAKDILPLKGQLFYFMEDLRRLGKEIGSLKIVYLI